MKNHTPNRRTNTVRLTKQGVEITPGDILFLAAGLLTATGIVILLTIGGVM